MAGVALSVPSLQEKNKEDPSEIQAEGKERRKRDEGKAREALLPPGFLLKRQWKLLKMVGAGGFGQVWLAQDLDKKKVRKKRGRERGGRERGHILSHPLPLSFSLSRFLCLLWI
jgi:serine/threonine protein kinase